MPHPITAAVKEIYIKKKLNTFLNRSFLSTFGVHNHFSIWSEFLFRTRVALYGQDNYINIYFVSKIVVAEICQTQSRSEHNSLCSDQPYKADGH